MISFASYQIDIIGDNFLEEYWDHNKNNINPFNLSKKSNNKIFIKCQNCNESYITTCHNFNSKRICNNCVSKEKYLSSFYKIKEYINSENTGNNCVLITNEQDFIKLIDINKGEKSNIFKLKIKCGICLNKIFITDFRSFKFQNKKQCNLCSCTATHDNQKKKHDEFEKEVYNIVGNEYLIISKYSGAKENIILKHNTDKCNYYEWNTNPNSFLNGTRCPICQLANSGELYRLDGNIIIKDFISKGLIPKFESKYYINNRQKLPFICNNHKDKGIQYVTYSDLNKNCGCKFCSIEKRSGEFCYRWNGGVSSLNKHLRACILDWKKRSMKKCNYKCIITGERFTNIHHLIGFDYIRDEVLKESNLDLRDEINKYNNNELKLLEDICIKLHEETLFGICLCKEIHKLFHDNYGYGNNSVRQFIEFIIKISDNEFKDYFINNNINLNINYELFKEIITLDKRKII